MSTPYTPSPTYHSTISVTVDGDPADAAEFNTPYQQCADNAAYCKQVIDPLVLGGTISPATTLFIDQHVVIPTESLTANSLVANSVLTSHGALTVDTTSHLKGDVTADHHINCETLTVTSASRFEGDLLAVGPSATFNCPTEVDGSFTASANSTLGSSNSDLVTVKASSVVLAPMTFGLPGRATWTAVLGNNFDNSTYLEGTQYIFWGTTTLTADRIQFLEGSLGDIGDHILLTYYGTTHTLTFRFPGSTSVSLGASGTHWSLHVLVGGVWQQAASGT